MMTLGQAWRHVQAQLEDTGKNPAPHEGRTLAAHVMGYALLNLVQEENTPLTPEQEHTLMEKLAERTMGRPLAYVLGQAPFWKHDWLVNESVLIPRPDTEILLHTALSFLQGFPHTPLLAVEAGIGSGCLMGSLLLEVPHLAGVATDISESAITIAQQNMERHRIANRCTLLRTNLLAGVPAYTGPESVQLVLSNPPYISNAEWAALEPCVRDHEPPEALTGAIDNPEGLALYRPLTHQAYALLKPDGMLAVEMGPTQASAIQEIFEEAGFEGMTCTPDLAGRPRVISGLKPNR